MTQQDSIKVAQKNFQIDSKASQKFLFDVRCGGVPEIMYDPMTGWELFMDGHGVIFPLESCVEAVNMILQALTYHYQRLSAVLGDPDKKWDIAGVQQLHRTDDTHKTKPTGPMTDRLALEEVEAAKETLQRHYDSGFLLGFWSEQYDGFQYRYADGDYARRAEIEVRDEA